jgi:hypothetical protein
MFEKIIAKALDMRSDRSNRSARATGTPKRKAVTRKKTTGARKTR